MQRGMAVVAFLRQGKLSLDGPLASTGVGTTVPQMNMQTLAQSLFRLIGHLGTIPAGESRSPRESLRMRRRLVALFLLGAALTLSGPNASAETPAEGNQEAILWREPGDIAARSLLYGPGGAEHQPRGNMVFVDEDHLGTNPKFHVRDAEGTQWTVQMGVEARPETAAAHLLWAAGYYTDEDYFVPSVIVEGLPSHLQRGQNLIGK